MTHSAEPFPPIPPPLPGAGEPIGAAQIGAAPIGIGAVAALPIAQAIRFCRTCGREWDAVAQTCTACDSRPAAGSRNEQARQQYDVERRSISSAVWLYFSLLAVSIFTMIVITVSGEKHTLALVTFAQVAMSLIIIAWAIKDRALLRGAFAVPKIGWLALAVPVGVVTYAFAHGVLWVLHAELHVPVMNAAEDYQGLPNGLLLGVLGVCVQPAVFEELGFRGLILPSLQRALTTFEAITVTALIFGILHLTVLSLPHLVAMGWMAGWLRTRSGSLYPAMVLHFTHNALVLASDWYGGSLLW
ncbi:MAG: Abortive infection protein [Phycisphaerales bacterium]|nr:Abortive infection protein [Phycisphaerales bacterium]